MISMTALLSFTVQHKLLCDGNQQVTDAATAMAV